MKFSLAAAATALLASTTLAAPLEERADAVSMSASVPEWTIVNMKRVCTSSGTSCTWTFGINTHTAPTTPCKFTVTGHPANETNSSGHVCGAFTVSTGWSDQFGPGKGFTVVPVVENAKGLIAYPSYTDAQLAGGKVVKPNQSYPVQKVSS